MSSSQIAPDRERVPEAARGAGALNDGRAGRSIGIPRSDRKDATRECILDAATQLLAQKGYAALRVAAVAEAAGVSLGGQLHHFPTKDLLVLGVLERLSVRVMQFATGEAAGAPDDVDPLVRISRSAERFFATPEFLIYLDIFLSVRRDVLLGEAAVKLLQANRRAIEDAWVPQLHTLGVSGEQAILIIRSLWSLSRGLAISSLGEDGRPDNWATISFAIDALRGCGPG